MALESPCLNANFYIPETYRDSNGLFSWWPCSDDATCAPNLMPPSVFLGFLLLGTRLHADQEDTGRESCVLGKSSARGRADLSRSLTKCPTASTPLTRMAVTEVLLA